ncbi:MAG: hypothetical protein EHM22_05755 [Actinobacteria bacterium]|nr:MAG: hypothetical protein EHM22_05755 [Actinomycetota bacterium]
MHDPLAGPPGRRGSPNGFHDPDRPRRGRGLERVEALVGELFLLLELLARPSSLGSSARARSEDGGSSAVVQAERIIAAAVAAITMSRRLDAGG